MKFLCQNCKAKYQIADEKLHNRAVRMKCRKCGTVIEVPSPSGMTPSEPDDAEAPGVRPSAASVPRPMEPPRSVPRAGRPPPPRGKMPRPPAPAQPARSRIAPAPPRPAPEPESSALEEAFTRNVREAEQLDVSEAIEVLSAGAAEEWYVGVNGVPLGPVRLSALRQKAAQGVINEESLVWREGFEEWLPLRTFPELVVLVREAREMGARNSFLPSQPAPRQSVTPAPLRIASSSKPPIVVEQEQEPATVVVPSGAALQSLAHVTSDPFGYQPRIDSFPSSPSGAGMTNPSMGQASAERPSVAEDEPRRSIVEDLAVGVRRQVRMHPALYVLIAIAAGFGATGAVVLLTGDRTPALPPTIQVVTVTAPPAEVPEAPAEAAGVEIEEATVTGGKAAAGRPGPVAASAGAPAPEKAGTLPSRVGLGQGPSLAGPTVGPAGGGASGGRAQLDQSDIERVVASQRVSVKRRCWEPALAGRDRNAPSSAKVNVSIVIGPDGSVRSASASGGTGYPGLASCVASRVRGWRFPPAGGESHASIPFAFFAQ